jgi:hypothetical protein
VVLCVSGAVVIGVVDYDGWGWLWSRHDLGVTFPWDTVPSWLLSCAFVAAAASPVLLVLALLTRGSLAICASVALCAASVIYSIIFVAAASQI